MADIALQASAVAERSIRVVKKPSHADQATYPAAEAITAGAGIRLDSSTGRWTNANGTVAGELPTHIAWRTVAAGESLTGVRGCLLDGYVLDALNYGAAVYASDTDGRLSDTAGTTSRIVGTVAPGYATLLGVAPDKMLDVGSMGN